ncbi:hypothetical protein [Roseovarius sp. EL26]|uniref:hypothetical protein n=1 Tax=Roseovarius sp. EL26 TaxID=2126672 RepID=UPI000EA3112D|nr:hypothetical protein [Roseovarius sp. EL26]
MTKRFGIWNQKLAREGRQRLSPFYARHAMSGLGHGLKCEHHVALIKEYLANCLHISINGEAPPSQYSGGVFSNTFLESRILAGKVMRRLRKQADLQSSRSSVIREAIETLPNGFLHGKALNYADYGAQRFLKMYKEAAS